MSARWSDARRSIGFIVGVLAWLGAGALGCQKAARRTVANKASSDAGAPPWGALERAPAAPLGMVWVPPGALIAGTPETSFPRLAEQEMPGEQVMLDGFFIDVFAYPTEEGAIPRTGLSQPEAARA